MQSLSTVGVTGTLYVCIGGVQNACPPLCPLHRCWRSCLDGTCSSGRRSDIAFPNQVPRQFACACTHTHRVYSLLQALKLHAHFIPSISAAAPLWLQYWQETNLLGRSSCFSRGFHHAKEANRATHVRSLGGGLRVMPWCRWAR